MKKCDINEFYSNKVEKYKVGELELEKWELNYLRKAFHPSNTKFIDFILSAGNEFVLKNHNLTCYYYCNNNNNTL